MNHTPDALNPAKLFVGALVGGALTLALFQLYDASIVMAVELPEQPTGEQLEVYNEAFYWFSLKKASIQIGTLGLLLGAMMGLLACRGNRLKSGLLAALAGGLLGGFGGALTGIAHCFFSGYRDSSPVVLGVTLEPLLQGAVCQLLAWCFAGAGVGLGLCWGCLGAKSSGAGVAAGVLAGVAFSMAYIVLAALAFPNSNSLFIVPEPWIDRCVWMALGSGMLAACIIVAVRPSPAKSPSAVEMAG